MSESRIVAVDHVELQARPDSAAGINWFYADFLGFQPVQQPQGAAVALRFRSADLEVRYRLLEDAVIEPVDHRVTLLVPSLLAARKVLDKARITYDLIRGMAFTDRCLSLLDPGGNRVALRQMWRLVT